MINKRISRYSLIAHVLPFKTAELVSEALIALLKTFSMCVHTLTTDNGREFAQHERIAAMLESDFCFAHPYSSWERGANTPTEIELAMPRLQNATRSFYGTATTA
jgi:IS30 family transposase